MAVHFDLRKDTATVVTVLPTGTAQRRECLEVRHPALADVRQRCLACLFEGRGRPGAGQFPRAGYSRATVPEERATIPRKENTR
ncbi:hypothetical protein GCM10009579_15940 [Streptomyces javensis]|uniref:Uncharacterized protein n=1 Tax=Streptomyces javensis TaxID=114698 RepID=A0ABN1WPB4_9ACTN